MHIFQVELWGIIAAELVKYVVGSILVWGVFPASGQLDTSEGAIHFTDEYYSNSGTQE